MKQRTYAHVDQTKRDRLQALLESGHRLSQIARILEVNKSTMSREVKRNRKKRRMQGGTRDGPYLATLAGHKAYVRRHLASWQEKKITQHNELKVYVTKHLKKHWSPDDIAGRMKQDNETFYASKNTIYQWLYSSYGQYWCKYLYSQQYHPKRRKKKKMKRILIPLRKSIALRPLGAANKTRYGHYEADTMVKQQGHQGHEKRSKSSKYEL
jgi:transposase, IS30 family